MKKVTSYLMTFVLVLLVGYVLLSKNRMRRTIQESQDYVTLIKALKHKDTEMRIQKPSYCHNHTIKHYDIVRDGQMIHLSLKYLHKSGVVGGNFSRGERFYVLDTIQMRRLHQLIKNRKN